MSLRHLRDGVTKYLKRGSLRSLTCRLRRREGAPGHRDRHGAGNNQRCTATKPENERTMTTDDLLFTISDRRGNQRCFARKIGIYILRQQLA